MIKTPEIVEGILIADEVALSAFSDGTLNLSAYAKKIRKQVEERTKKSVRAPSIVVALSRLRLHLKKRKPIVPKVTLRAIAAKSGLVEVAYPKTAANRRRLTALYSQSDFTEADFFTVTQGVGEISIIVPAGLQKRVTALFKGEAPKIALSGVASLTVTFEESYILTPNTTFAIVRTLAVHHINILEVVSTFTELTFLLKETDLQRAFNLLSDLLERPKNLG